jgi:hypothetical protein
VLGYDWFCYVLFSCVNQVIDRMKELFSRPWSCGSSMKVVVTVVEWSVLQVEVVIELWEVCSDENTLQYCPRN